MHKTKQCHACKTAWEGKGQPSAKERCMQCGEEIHVCLNCRFYDERQSQSCQVPNVDFVSRKERANYCDEFQFAERDAAGGADEAQKAKDAWKKLFKK